jgi:hypothetical protein
MEHCAVKKLCVSVSVFVLLVPGMHFEVLEHQRPDHIALNRSRAIHSTWKYSVGLGKVL